MSRKRRKEITRHLTEDELDEILAEANDNEIVRRLMFLKNVYQGDLIKEAANCVGWSESTGGRWADRWNEGGLEGLAPSFGQRAPKLDQDEQDHLLELLREGQSWKSQEIQHLLNEEFGVEYHLDHLAEFLDNFRLSKAIHGQSVPLGLRTLKRSSKNASTTYLTRTKTTNRTTNTTVMMRKAGSSTMTSVRMAGLSSDFLTYLIYSRGITHSGCATSTTHTSPDRWFVVLAHRPWWKQIPEFLPEKMEPSIHDSRLTRETVASADPDESLSDNKCN